MGFYAAGNLTIVFFFWYLRTNYYLYLFKPSGLIAEAFSPLAMSLALFWYFKNIYVTWNVFCVR